eukprot:gene13350-28288_t
MARKVVSSSLIIFPLLSMLPILVHVSSYCRTSRTVVSPRGNKYFPVIFSSGSPPILNCKNKNFPKFFATEKTKIDQVNDQIKTTATNFNAPRLSIYGKATTDTGVRRMLSHFFQDDTFEETILISLLNSFIPTFRSDPVNDTDRPSVRGPELKQTIIDFHAITEKGIRYNIEIQVRRHAMYDERTLFCSDNTYAEQKHLLSDAQLQGNDWYKHLNTSIIFQILDYDINDVPEIPEGVNSILRGFRSTCGSNSSYLNKPFERPFMKSFTYTDMISNEFSHTKHIVQLDLSIAKNRQIFRTPSKDFTEQEWWLSILLYAPEFQYTSDELEDMIYNQEMITLPIFSALQFLEIDEWDKESQEQYQKDLINYQKYNAIFAAERSEGVRRGSKRKLKELIHNMHENDISVHTICRVTNMFVDDVEDILKSKKY